MDLWCLTKAPLYHDRKQFLLGPGASPSGRLQEAMASRVNVFLSAQSRLPRSASDTLIDTHTGETSWASLLK